MSKLRRNSLEISIKQLVSKLMTLSVLALIIQAASSFEKFLPPSLMRFLQLGPRSRDAIHRPDVRKRVKHLAILSTIVCVALVTSVYASIGSSAWSEIPAVSDILSFAYSSASGLVLVKDSTPPTISGLTDVVAEATGDLTIVPLSAPTVTDDLDPTPTVTNDAPADGYPVGTSSITWTAEDAAGNIATAVQKVTLVDTTPPLIAAPPDVVVHLASPINYTQVSLGTATVKDLIDGNPYVTNDAPPIGFPVGVTTVRWIAVDASGNYATDTQLVSVMVIEDTKADANSIQPTSGSSSGYFGGGSSGSGSSSGGSGTDNSDIMDRPLVGGSGNSDSSFTATGSTFFDVPHHPTLSLQQFSIAAWFKTSADFSGNAMIVNKGGFGSEAAGENMNYGIWMDKDEKVRAGFEAASGTDYFLKSAASYNDNNWHYAVFTYDGSFRQDLYVDATLVSWRTFATTPPDTGGTQPVRIAANSGGSNSFFTGEIAEVKVWNRALVATEVTEQFDSSQRSSSAPLTVAYTVPDIGGVKSTSVGYGATVNTVCDSGCTHKTVSSAIDSLPSSGGKVILKGLKTYELTSTVTLRSNLVIEFEPGASVVHSVSGKIFSGDSINNVMFINPVITKRIGPHDAIYITNGDTIIVKGGVITGVKGGSDDDKSNGFECRSCKNVLVESGTYSSWSRPIAATTVTAVRDGTSENIWVEGNSVTDGSIECMRIAHSVDVHVNFNDVRDCGNNGIDVGFNLRVEAKNNRLTNTGIGSVDNAVGMHTDGADTVILLENIIAGTGTDGISICGSDNNYVVGNTISNTGTTLLHGGGNGIEVIRCGGNTSIPEKTIIDRNHISNTATAGIYITSTATDVLITNNTIQNYGTSDILDNSKKAIIGVNIS